MTKDEAKRYVREHLEDYLQAKGIDPHKGNFHCLNPEHEDKNPSMSFFRDKNGISRCHCFSCGKSYDTFDLIAIDYHTSGAETFRKAYELFRLEVDGKEYGNGMYQNRPKNEQYTTPNTQQIIKEVDFSEAVKEAHARLLQTPEALDHLHRRGLSDTIIRRYQLGYDPQGINHFLREYPDYQSKNKKAALYRYIFPYPNAEGGITYFSGEIADRGAVDKFTGKYIKIKGKQQLFNERYIVAGAEAPRVVFITEGIYDALSVEEVGGHAIALTGTGGGKRLLNLWNEHHPNTTYIIALDSDGPGKKVAEALKNQLDAAGVPCRMREESPVKDENEELIHGREAFQQNIQHIIDEVEAEAEQREAEERGAYMQTAAAWRMQSFYDTIEASKHTPYFSTGFPAVDQILDGGLYPGLYTVGAISSLGKTTFCLQVMDNIAEAGNDVLIFSLEMASSELIAKSISRLTLIEDFRKNHRVTLAKTTRGILTGSRYARYSEEEIGIIRAAMAHYIEYADHVFIHEGVGDIGVGRIREEVQRHIQYTGRLPVVLVDYLQILAPYNDRATDKQNTDKAVLELKRISRDFAIPVVCISSFNRDNYTSPVNMASYKESGAVEYSSDVLIGLQYEGMDYREDESKEKRMKRIGKLLRDEAEAAKNRGGQKVEVKILKNRNGARGTARLDFIPMFNYFTEEKEPRKEETAGNEPDFEWEGDEEED